MARAPTSRGLEASPLHLLHRAGQCAGDVFLAEAARAGLTPRQFAILHEISVDEGLSQTRLVERTGIDRSTLADVMRRLVKKGVVQRRRTREDARAYAVKLTDAGRRVLQDAAPLVTRADERLLEALPPARRARFVETLNEIVLRLGKLAAERRS